MKFVIGYASLLSKVSIKRLFPNVGRIVPVTIENHARCFNSFGTLSIKAGLENTPSRHLSHASAIYRPNSVLYALAFELDDIDYQTYVKHEFRYDLRAVHVQPIDSQESFEAIICYESVDHNIDVSLIGLNDRKELYDMYKTTSLWHTDHLPAKAYLEHCIASARDLNEAVLNNFLDVSFLHDRKTSIGTYLRSNQIDVGAYIRKAKLSSVF